MSTCLLINADHWIFEFSVTKTPLADLTQLTFCYFLGSFIMKLAGFTINLQIVGYPLLVTVSLLPYLSGHHEIFKSFLYILGKCIIVDCNTATHWLTPKFFTELIYFLTRNIFYNEKIFFMGKLSGLKLYKKFMIIQYLLFD